MYDNPHQGFPVNGYGYIEYVYDIISLGTKYICIIAIEVLIN
jgi:hypothetical protein